jgi:hypothetical protein
MVAPGGGCCHPGPTLVSCVTLLQAGRCQRESRKVNYGVSDGGDHCDPDGGQAAYYVGRPSAPHGSGKSAAARPAIGPGLGRGLINMEPQPY